jgi:hypothetical protein
LLAPVDLAGAVVTVDPAHAQHDIADYMAGEREADYLLMTIKANQPGLRRDAHDITGAAISKEIVRGVTTLDASRG